MPAKSTKKSTGSTRKTTKGSAAKSDRTPGGKAKRTNNPASCQRLRDEGKATILDLKAYARELKIEGYSKMNKEELCKAINRKEGAKQAAKTRATNRGTSTGVSRTTSKSKKTPAKKTPAKKTPAKKTPAKKTPAKKTPAKKATTARKTTAGKGGKASSGRKTKLAAARRDAEKYCTGKYNLPKADLLELARERGFQRSLSKVPKGTICQYLGYDPARQPGSRAPARYDYYFSGSDEEGSTEDSYESEAEPTENSEDSDL